MIARNENSNIVLEFSEDETIVLLEWLHNFNEQNHTRLFQDQAEERILFDLEAELEKIISVPFKKNYDQILSKARKKLRDEE